MEQPDSTELTLSELKQTLGLLTELEFRRQQNVQNIAKENIYKNIIKDYEANQELYKQKIINLESALGITKPAWYDSFWFGAGVTGLVFTTIILIAR